VLLAFRKIVSNLTATTTSQLHVVDAMVAVFPDACRLPDDVFGHLPLHIACRFGASEDILRFIMDSFPDAVKLTDKVGDRLPLHYACFDGFPNAVSLLIEANRQALTVRDIDGNTPEDLCQESFSPLRGAILKRIQDYNAPANTKVRLIDTKRQASSLLDHRKTSELLQSSSECIMEAMHASAPALGRSTKLKLPLWANGRKSQSNLDESSSKHRSSLESSTGPEIPREDGISHRRNSFDTASLATPTIFDTASLATPTVFESSSDGSSSSIMSHEKKPIRWKSFDDAFNNPAKTHHLQLQKAALVEEYKHAHENIMTERAKAETSKTKMEALRIQAQEILDAIEQERISMDSALSAVRSNEEIIAQHERSIQLVDEQLDFLPVSLSSPESSSSSL